jgi:hypothetical protein
MYSLSLMHLILTNKASAGLTSTHASVAEKLRAIQKSVVVKAVGAGLPWKSSKSIGFVKSRRLSLQT